MLPFSSSVSVKPIGVLHCTLNRIRRRLSMKKVKVNAFAAIDSVRSMMMERFLDEKKVKLGAHRRVSVHVIDVGVR